MSGLRFHDPCSKCGRPVTHDGSTKFPLCADCTFAAKQEQDYEQRLKRTRALFQHAQSPCQDPDCEIHNPWCCEDEAEMYLALAWFIAGAQGYAKHLDGFLEEYQRNITDEMGAPSHP